MQGRVSIPDHVVHRGFAEETVVLNLQSGTYHGLNKTAGDLLELLGEHGDIDTAARLYAAASGAPEDRVATDLRELCTALVERGLIEVEHQS